ncbi:MAG: SRPBCC family protein [Deltaproteobacteria bacterium]|nr:SRPBCC family protein [Deltaproteobacteria bacterium]
MLKPFLIVLAVLIGVPTAIWGFAGAWVLTAIIPAFVLGATIAHFRAPESDGRRLRPGVIVLGGVFGLGFSTASVLLQQAAVSPEAISIEESVLVPAPRSMVWELLNDPAKRPRWNSWIKGLEPTGKGGPPAIGRVYRAELSLEHQYEVPAALTITDYEPEARFGYRIDPGEIGATPVKSGTGLEDIREVIVLADEDGGTRVTYQLSYNVRSTIGRVMERVVMRRSLDKVLEQSLTNLRALVLE